MHPAPLTPSLSPSQGERVFRSRGGIHAAPQIGVAGAARWWEAGWHIPGTVHAQGQEPSGVVELLW